MIFERIIFNIVAFTLFIIFFIKMIKKNDTTYIDILCLQFVGIGLSFLYLLIGRKMNILVFIIIYLFSIILPIIIIYLEEKKGINFPVIINILIADFYVLFNKEESAKIYLLNLIEKYPNSYYGHKMLAKIYEKQKNISNAIDEYVRAIEINKKDYVSYYKIAKFLNELDRKDESIQMLQDLIKIKPDNLEATMLLGDILFNENRFKEAANIYYDSLKYNPGNYDIYYNLGMVCTMLNDFQKAKEYYETAANINSLIYSGKFSLAQIAMIYGNLEKAKMLFMECINSETLEPEGYFYLAQIAIIKGEKENAINYLNMAIELDSTICKKIEGELIFAPIIKMVRLKGINENVYTEKLKLNKKEEKVKKHLEDTFNLVNKLSNNDLKMMKNMKEKNTDQLNIKERDEQ